MPTVPKYKAEFCEALIAHMSQGRSFLAFGAECSVSRKTLYQWVDVHADFGEAKGIADLKSLAYWEALGLGAITGQVPGFQQATYIFKMKCRFRKYGYNELAPMDEDDDQKNDLSTVPTEKLLKLIIK